MAIMDFDKEPEKMFYSVGEVSRMFNVNASLIRFWEKEFDVLRPRKNKKGNRLFTREDIDNMKLIYHLVKERGFTLEGARKKLKENRSDADHSVQVASSLRRIKVFLEELKEKL